MTTETKTPDTFHVRPDYAANGWQRFEDGTTRDQAVLAAARIARETKIPQWLATDLGAPMHTRIMPDGRIEEISRRADPIVANAPSTAPSALQRATDAGMKHILGGTMRASIGGFGSVRRPQ